MMPIHIRTLGALALAALFAGGAFAQSGAAGAGGRNEGLTLADVAALALDKDAGILVSRAQAAIAALQYQAELNKAQPKFNLSLTPFSWDDRRVLDFSGFPPDYADKTTLSLGGGLNLSQALPSAGSLSAQASANFQLGDPAGSRSYALAPKLSASLRQPLLAGGQFLPFDAAAGSKASAFIAAEQAGLDDKARRGSAVRAALESAARVLVLRRNYSAQQASLAGALRRAETLDLRRGAGTATEDAALELALAAEVARQGLVDTQLALRDAERRLAAALGLGSEASMAGFALSEKLPFLAPLSSLELGGNTDLIKAGLAVEKARADAHARSIIDAPTLSASLSAEPRYPDTRADTGDFGSAFDDFFEYDGNAGINWNFSVIVDVPLSAGAAKAYRRGQDAQASAIAEALKAQTERSVLDRAQSLLARRDGLSERLAIQRRIVALDERKVERARSLIGAGTLGSDALEDALVARDLAAAEQLRLELELFLAELDLRLAQGDDISLLAAAF
jgi:outer membrane protein TolC